MLLYSEGFNQGSASRAYIGRGEEGGSALGIRFDKQLSLSNENQ
jgi:hypothetical protein